ncbi:M56 family metallopeptidase [Longibacter sp.]|uniref:M56 family metallopeptidase n=1 Tax=Longibacter sp. TaxID=2045415 RepID=UPI003EB75349
MDPMIRDAMFLDSISMYPFWLDGSAVVGDWLLAAFWQGAVIAAVAVLLLAILQQARPVWRYLVSVTALLTLLLVPLLSSRGGPAEGSTAPPGPVAVSSMPAPMTAPPAIPAMPEAPVASAPATEADVEASTGFLPALSSILPGQQLSEWRRAVERVAPVWVGFWLLGVSLLAFRLLGGIWWIRRLRASSRPLDREAAGLVRRAHERAGSARSAQVRCSSRIDTPILCGWWRPMVILPASLCRECPEKELEALLVHEVSHVRRHDVMVGWVQAIAETLLFFHPGVWWLTRQIRREREHVVDDRVVDAGVAPVTYAQALTRVAEQAASVRPARGIALTPAASDGVLLQRIRRLVTAHRGDPVPRTTIIAAILTVLVVPLFAAACSSNGAAADRHVERDVETRTIVIPHGDGDTSRSGTVIRDSIIIRNGSTGRVERLVIREDTTWPGEVDSLLRKAFPFHGDSLAFRFDGEIVDPDRLAERLRRSMIFPNIDSLPGARPMDVDSLRSFSYTFSDSIGPGSAMIFRLRQLGDSLAAGDAERQADLLRRQADRLRKQAEAMERQADAMARELEERKNEPGDQD